MHLVFVAVVVLCYGYAEIRWTAVKVVGLHAFPGSPDWGGTFMSAYDSYHWMSGMLFGLLAAGIPLSLLARAAPSMGTLRTIVPIAAIVCPALALILGYMHESRTVPDDGRSSEMRFNPLVKRTFASYAGSSAYRER